MRVAIWTAIGALAAGAAGLAMTPSKAVESVITPVPIPAGPNYPLPASTINGWIATSNETAMRGHAWAIWAAMNARSGQSYNGTPLPIWETWADSQQIFTGQGVTGGADAFTQRMGRPRLLNGFQRPLQFRHGSAAARQTLALTPDDQLLTANVKLNPEAVAFVNAPQAGPGGTYYYNSGQSLSALNAAWPTGTPPQARGINDFPVPAIEIKPVFSMVKATGLTAMPIWRGLVGSTNRANPTPSTWTNCVIIDPAYRGAMRTATTAEIARAGPSTAGLACRSFLYGPLSLFFSLRMSASDAQAFAAATGAGAGAGDYAVLTAMHVNTKEIPFWTWQTFWWQAGADTPLGFPGSKAGQPASLPAPWNNYASCANYAQTTTPGGSTMDVCFNPYLETSPNIPAGITSNCMSCHGVARIATNAEYPTAYTRPIAFFSDPAYFAGATHTDFSWAVASAP